MKNLILSSLFLSTLAASAFASKADYPTDVYSRPTTLPEGVFEANVDLGINLSDGTAFKQFTLAPNLSYGATKDLTVGLVHTGGPSIIRAGSLCLGDSAVCAKAYNSFGLEGRYQLTRGQDPTGLLFGLDVNALSPDFALAFRVGADFHLHPSASLNVNIAPQVGIGITKRDYEFGAATPLGGFSVSAPYNRDYVSVPVQLNFKQSDNLNLQVTTGINGMLTGYDFGDTYRVPAGVGVLYATSDHAIDIGARFVFPALIAGDAYKVAKADGINSRELGLFFTYRN